MLGPNLSFRMIPAQGNPCAGLLMARRPSHPFPVADRSADGDIVADMLFFRQSPALALNEVGVAVPVFDFSKRSLVITKDKDSSLKDAVQHPSKTRNREDLRDTGDER
jgi:hypothetical protein